LAFEICEAHAAQTGVRLQQDLRTELVQPIKSDLPFWEHPRIHPMRQAAPLRRRNIHAAGNSVFAHRPQINGLEQFHAQILNRFHWRIISTMDYVLQLRFILII